MVTGSFEDAERQRAVAMARLTPAQRVRMVCEMAALQRQIAVARKQWLVEETERNSAMAKTSKEAKT